MSEDHEQWADSDGRCPRCGDQIGHVRGHYADDCIKSLRAQVAPSHVFVCLYHHRFGTDCGVYDTAENAYRGACMTVLDTLNEEIHSTFEENEDVRTQIVNHIKAGRYGDALALYEESTDESFEIEDRRLFRDLTDDGVKNAASVCRECGIVNDHKLQCSQREQGARLPAVSNESESKK